MGNVKKEKRERRKKIREMNEGWERERWVEGLLREKKRIEAKIKGTKERWFSKLLSARQSRDPRTLKWTKGRPVGPYSFLFVFLPTFSPSTNMGALRIWYWFLDMFYIQCNFLIWFQFDDTKVPTTINKFIRVINIHFIRHPWSP